MNTPEDRDTQPPPIADTLLPASSDLASERRIPRAPVADRARAVRDRFARDPQVNEPARVRRGIVP